MVKGIHTFPMNISPNIEHNKFVIAFYDVIVQHLSQYATGTVPIY